MSQSVPQNINSLFYQVVAITPKDDDMRDYTRHKRLTEELQHLGANTEEPNLPREVWSALPLLADGFPIASLVSSHKQQCIYTPQPPPLILP